MIFLLWFLSFCPFSPNFISFSLIFQDKAQLIMHIIGAGILFLGGLAYGGLQSWLSYHMGTV